jgi:hypothetical protein
VELREFILAGLNDAHRMGDIAMDGLTPEVAHFEAGGTTNNIAQLMTLLTASEDSAVARLKGGDSILQSQNWYGRTGIPEGPRAFWQKGWSLELAAFGEYRDLVKAAATEYFQNIDASDLDREVEWFNGPRPASTIIQVIIVNHMLGHSGEISALKGVQGLKGLPF